MTRSVIAADVRTALNGLRFRYRHELDLHAGLAQAFERAGIDYEREVRVAGGFIDFLIAGQLGVEVKIKGSTAALGRQLARYAAEDRITELLVLTTRPQHRYVTLESSLARVGKPITVHTLGLFG